MVTWNRNYAILTSAIAGLLMVMSSAQASKNEGATLALLEQTGITAQIYSLEDLIRESSQIHVARCNSNPAAEIITGFNADSVILDLVSAFEQNHRQSIGPIENWYQSPLAIKIQLAEKEQIDFSALTIFLQSEMYKNSYRQTQISKIIDNLQVPRFVAILGTEVEYAGIMHSGCIESSETSGKVNREQKLADITREDKDLTAMLLRGDIVAETAYLYKNLSNEELNHYEAFTSSESGKLFFSSLIDAVQESFQLAGDRLTSSVQTDLHGYLDF